MAFCQPDMTFTPGSFAGTGFQYLDENYNTVKQQIANLKQKGVHARSLVILLINLRYIYTYTPGVYI